MTAKKLKHLSKFLSLILRHRPQVVHLTLDEQGWANTQELIEKINEHGTALTLPLLEEVVANNNKKRFAFNKDKSKIRASQGHSIPIKLNYEPVSPPPQLYHGTATRHIHSIRKEGLKKRSRHHVHLSADINTAKQVGMRHGVPVILTIRAAAMYEAGYEFFVSENGVWLTEHVPVEFIGFYRNKP